MDNVQMTIDKAGFLNIRIDLESRSGLSKSGRSVKVATTSGNVKIEGAEHIFIGLNAYTFDKNHGEKLVKCRKYYQVEQEKERVALALKLLDKQEQVDSVDVDVDEPAPF